jgi:hypothetical protein
MNKIEHNLSYFPQLLIKSRSPYYMTYIDGIVSNPHNDKKTITAKRFIVDTGAAITVLNSSFGFLFHDNDTPIIDHVNIQYGGGATKEPLPVYLIKLKIKGVEFEFPAAFDKHMQLTSLLGHYGFLNSLEHLGISKQRKKLTIIK